MDGAGEDEIYEGYAGSDFHQVASGEPKLQASEIPPIPPDDHDDLDGDDGDFAPWQALPQYGFVQGDLDSKSPFEAASVSASVQGKSFVELSEHWTPETGSEMLEDLDPGHHHPQDDADDDDDDDDDDFPF